MDHLFHGWKTIGSAIPRGIAFFLGLFTLLNVVGEWRAPGFDANLWWISLPGNWYVVDQAMLLWSATSLLWFATRRQFVRVEKIGLFVTFGGLFASSIWNAMSYFRLLAEREIQSLSPVPFSSLVAACLALILFGVWQTTPETRTRSPRFHRLVVALTVVVCGLLFPVAQMICFGMTDYRRNADVIVVFGAKVYEDGQLSSILEERVRTGCELYHQGLAHEILFSGGPGIGSVHETEGMRLRAMELGVPDTAIAMDSNGLDTDSTAINTLRMGQSRSWRRILAVSQFFHLPRIKLAFHRQGSEVYTVPAKRIYHFRYLPYFMLREVAAWWLYYVRPLF